jgi:hypothetical protein
VTCGTYLTNPTFFIKNNFFQHKQFWIRISVKVQMVLLREAREPSVFRISGQNTKCVQQSLQKRIRTLANRIALIAGLRETVSVADATRAVGRQ